MSKYIVTIQIEGSKTASDRTKEQVHEALCKWIHEDNTTEMANLEIAVTHIYDVSEVPEDQGATT